MPPASFQPSVIDAGACDTMFALTWQLLTVAPPHNQTTKPAGLEAFISYVLSAISTDTLLITASVP